ncbi:VlmB-like protein [Actinophytocola gossypii]|uniref:VlmB-like protein n=1 Tax=Actinophytocola gossypii TaxID=2812003 RepID=A0ABT2J4J5_9PSEU|nr:VlmB-like protein [Actinophytocola gossypii]MCT2582793.1 VlmB-like protein [Actinophytocola gossypii]
MITDWDSAPSLLDGATSVELTARDANLRYWLTNVPQGTLAGRPDGYDPALTVPAHMFEPGPLRDALVREYAFRTVAEDKAARALSFLVGLAPDTDTMEFYATQVLDEARHAMVFRDHLRVLGVTDLDAAAGDDIAAILDPLEEFGLSVMRDDFVGGVVMMAIIIEGALAPAAELSERKWRPLNPVAAEIDRGAGIDEIRHLTVGASIAREHLLAHPADRPRVVSLIREGMRMWSVLPVHDMVLRREILFQEGLDRYRSLVGDYEVWPGRRLVDTTPEERLATADRWSTEMKESRLRHIGLEEAL